MPQQDYLEAAYACGKEAAESAASWAIEVGRCDQYLAQTVLDLIDAGDPRVDEYLPARPNLSGEWADDPTPYSLYREITGDDPYIVRGDRQSVEALVDAIADEWERGVSDHFEAACQREFEAVVA